MMLFETSLNTPVFGLRREMNRLFDDVLNRTTPATAWIPPVDVSETDQEIVLSLELPGVSPDDCEVTADNGVLTVRGTKQVQRKEGDETQYYVTERSYGSFLRSFRLPKGVDESRITADFEHGVLHVRVPKAALPQPKKIAIGHGAAEQRSVGTGRPQGEQVQERSATQQKNTGPRRESANDGATARPRETAHA